MKRVASLDIIKMIAIFLVLVIHTIVIMPYFPRTWWSNLFTLFTVTCVPLFMMVNGALLLNKPFDRSKWAKRTIRLILLTILWKFLLVLFCCFFWSAGETLFTARTILEYLLGGSTIYGQLGYTWFLDMYIGLQLLFPVWKHLYDHEGGRYARLLIGVISITLMGGETLSMLLQPVATLTGRDALPLVFSHLGSFAPFTSYAVYLVYFFIGAFLYRAVSQPAENSSDAPVTRLSQNSRALYLAGLLSYAVLYAINRYQVHYQGVSFDVIQKYTNLFTVILTSALFVFFITRTYPAWLERLGTFVGRRTFGIYIIQAAPIRVLDVLVGAFGSLTGTILPNGEGMPSPVAMIWLLFLIAVTLLYSSAIVAGCERIPGLRRLLLR